MFAFPLLACVVAALAPSALAASPQVGPSSPCPQLFRYDSVGDPGKWTGNLLLDSKDDIHGVWIRLIFDSQVKDVIAEGYESVYSSDSTNEVLIKNRDVFLKAGSPANIKITVKYEEDRFPSLIGYRLNARPVCPEPNTQRTDFFSGDESATDFLSTIVSKAKPIVKPTFTCGLRQANYPWQASVFHNKGGNYRYICDATLISPSHVVLPAHCVAFTNNGAGIPAETLSVTIPSVKDRFEVTKVKVHPGYDPDVLADNIAVLELNVALKITDDVRPVCLTDDDDEDKGVILGKVIEADGKIGDRLAEARVEVDNVNTCQLKNPKLAGVLQDNTLCLSYEVASPCVGNSGSNIVAVDKVVILRGIVTVGPLLQKEKDCGPHSAVVAIDATKYYKWILRSIS